jgi:hypothetical protein
MAILGPNGLDLLAGLPGNIVDAVKKGKDLWDKIRGGSDEAALAAILASEAYKRLIRQGKTDEEAKKIIKEATPEELAELEKPEEPVEPPPEEPTQYDPTTDPRWAEYGNPPAGSTGEFAQKFDFENASDKAVNPSFGEYEDPHTRIALEGIAGPGGTLTPTQVIEAVGDGKLTQRQALRFFQNHPDFEFDNDGKMGPKGGNGWKGQFAQFLTVALTSRSIDVILNGERHKSQTDQILGTVTLGED